MFLQGRERLGYLTVSYAMASRRGCWQPYGQARSRFFGEMPGSGASPIARGMGSPQGMPARTRCLRHPPDAYWKDDHG